jgi:hypothetical protein
VKLTCPDLRQKKTADSLVPHASQSAWPLFVVLGCQHNVLILTVARG